MASKISGVAVAGIGAGALFLFAGIKGKSLLSTLQAVIRGKSPSSASAAAAIVPGSSSSSSSSASSPGGGGSPTANKALGQIMAAAYGWTGNEWAYLESGWQEESGWRTNAAYDSADPYNNAYGIPQANPGTKMASAGSNWKTSAATQIKWGLAYIASTYGSPSQVPGWSPSGPLPGYQGY